MNKMSLGIKLVIEVIKNLTTILKVSSCFVLVLYVHIKIYSALPYVKKQISKKLILKIKLKNVKHFQ